MGENGFSFSPISRHFLSFLLFLDTFSLILDTKVSRNGNDPKSVTNAGPEQPFRCLDCLFVCQFRSPMQEKTTQIDQYDTRPS